MPARLASARPLTTFSSPLPTTWDTAPRPISENAWLTNVCSDMEPPSLRGRLVLARLRGHLGARGGAGLELLALLHGQLLQLRRHLGGARARVVRERVIVIDAAAVALHGQLVDHELQRLDLLGELLGALLGPAGVLLLARHEAVALALGERGLRQVAVLDAAHDVL